MKEHPILFSAPMILALLADRKHVTRRLSKRWLKVKAGDRLWVRETWRPYCWREDGPITVQFRADGATMQDCYDSRKMSGDYESWYESIAVDSTDECEKAGLPKDEEGCYVWPNRECPLRWRPSIFMPRWCSRIPLECEEDARPERLQDITEEDAVLEGCEETPITDADIREAIENPMDESKALMVALGPGMITAKADYMMLWDDLHTKPDERWQDNPDVVRVGRFHRVEPS